MQGLIYNIQRFCIHDGPGIRTTVFFKGCNLNCAWCHNPESQSKDRQIMFYPDKCTRCGRCENLTIDNTEFFCPNEAKEICGRTVTTDDVIAEVMKDYEFYKNSGGGITLSGGEPLMQYDFTLSLLKLAKKNHLHTAIETCGYTSPDIIKNVVPLVDLFLWDIKDTDSVRHKEYTGVSNNQIISNLQLADSLGAKTRIRCILVQGVNTDTKHYENITHITSQLKHCEGVEFLPYHSYGGTKSLALGKSNSSNDNWVPSKKCITQATNYLKNKGISVF